MSEGVFKGWIPEAYLDEVVPPPRAEPSDWLVVGADVRLAGFDKDDPATVVIVDGDVMQFHGLTEFDDVRVTWRSKGDYTVHDAIAPAALCFCCDDDSDYVGSTIGEVIEYLEQSGLDPSTDLVISSYRWCDGTPFVLRQGAFVTPAAAKAARQ